MGAVTLIFLFGADQTDNKVTSKFCLLNQTLIVEVFGYVSFLLSDDLSYHINLFSGCARQQGLLYTSS